MFLSRHSNAGAQVIVRMRGLPYTSQGRTSCKSLFALSLCLSLCMFLFVCVCVCLVVVRFVRCSKIINSILLHSTYESFSILKK